MELRQIGLLAVLILIVMGFTVPVILHPLSSPTGGAVAEEPRLCQTDTDCNLNCGGTTTSVLCSMNLCQQTSCESYTAYPFSAEPTVFSLALYQGTTTLPLAAKQGDFFVSFEGETVTSYTRRMTLQQVLEKSGYLFVNDCINNVCGVSVTINGEEKLANPYYIPKAGDSITLAFS